MFYGLIADRLCQSPNDVEEMFLDLAEDQILYWTETAGKAARDEQATEGRSVAEIARMFGGQVVKGGAPRGR